MFSPKGTRRTNTADVCRVGSLDFTSEVGGEGFSVLQLTLAQVKTHFPLLRGLDPLTAQTLGHFSPSPSYSCCPEKDRSGVWLYNIKTRNLDPSLGLQVLKVCRDRLDIPGEAPCVTPAFPPHCSTGRCRFLQWSPGCLAGDAKRGRETKPHLDANVLLAWLKSDVKPVQGLEQGAPVDLAT